jgi:integrase/recombinase XerD
MTTKTSSTDFACLLQSFFVERLIQQRNMSPRTIESYRDSFRLLLNFAQQTLRKPPATLTLQDVDPALVSGFLDHLETARGNCVRSRNARLAAIHAFYRYVSLQYPQALRFAQQILAIPLKRFEKPLLGFLSAEEMKAVFGRARQIEVRRTARSSHVCAGVQHGSPGVRVDQHLCPGRAT